MQEEGLPLLVHGEVTDPEVDIFDREAEYINTVLKVGLVLLPPSPLKHYYHYYYCYYYLLLWGHGEV